MNLDISFIVTFRVDFLNDVEFRVQLMLFGLAAFAESHLLALLP